MVLKRARQKIADADATSLMTVEEAAALLSVSPQTVYRWADEGTNGLKRMQSTPVRLYAFTVKAYLNSGSR
jgi:excisionase family DNA binding protein